MIERVRNITITLVLDEETNAALIQAAQKSKRSKRIEAAIRLKDHLNKYPFSSDNFINPQREG